MGHSGSRSFFDCFSQAPYCPEFPVYFTLCFVLVLVGWFSYVQYVMQWPLSSPFASQMLNWDKSPFNYLNSLLICWSLQNWTLGIQLNGKKKKNTWLLKIRNHYTNPPERLKGNKQTTEDTKCWQEWGASIGNMNWYKHFGKLVFQTTELICMYSLAHLS